MLPYDMRDLAAETNARRRSEARSALIDAADAVPWHFYVTLTFRHEATGEEAARAFEHGYVPRLQQRSGGKVGYFGVAGRNGERGRVHVHALLHVAGIRRVSDCAAAWKEGVTQVEPFDVQAPAIAYIANHYGHSGGELLWDPPRPRDKTA